MKRVNGEYLFFTWEAGLVAKFVIYQGKSDACFNAMKDLFQRLLNKR